MGSDVAAVAFLVASALMFFPYFSSLFSLLGLRVIPELLNETSHRFPKRVNKLVAFAQTFLESCPRNEPRAFAWAARNDRNRVGRATGMECSKFARRLRLRTLRRHTRGFPVRH